MRCLIVDDEPLAQDVIEHYISGTEGLELVGKCTNAVQAFAMLNKEQIDLMFLDIQMPELSGLDFIRTLRQLPMIILTTAYSEYAVQGFELDVVDYLLKPISLERFLKAVSKARALKQPVQSQVVIQEFVSKPQHDSIFIRSDGKYIQLNPQDILFIEGLKNYLIIHTAQKKIITHSTMKSMEEDLSAFPFFIRVHKSYLINRKFITEIEGNMVKLDKQEVPVGGIYKDELMRSLKIM
ncbi:LytR/AlgR family response regulator transcription factor [Taibaiella soli]|uniref:DNA-binding response regulator n=1 Tax=Taibaiella soli TaxID=1649169 RepID=A0A2W2AFZ0_9BACT|nr:LytTR family DNA-binding domain-containing protein [Taibaiella soli]PZF72432.1 DNA-binding response regulator [Taibaiella soli]